MIKTGTQIGIFFGTDSGTTRLIAKKIAKQITKRQGDGVVAKPKNINRCSAEDLLGFDNLILGTPTYGDGVLPGVENGTDEAAWLEFLPLLVSADFSGVRIALYGLGDQETYPKHFAADRGRSWRLTIEYQVVTSRVDLGRLSQPI